MPNQQWDIGEFVSMRVEDSETGFRIVIEGDEKYKWLILDKINEIIVSQDDLKENELD